MEPVDEIPLSENCHHYTTKWDVPWDLQKYALSPSGSSRLTSLTRRSRYWSQRYSLFSLYDDGVCLTDDAWFGVTPEPVAK